MQTFDGIEKKESINLSDKETQNHNGSPEEELFPVN